jgi:hypothetical protein
MSSFQTSSGDPLPPELQDRVDAELSSGERLIWVGQPVPGAFQCQTIALAVVGLFFLGFTGIWFVLTLGMGALAGGEAPEAFGILGCFSLFGLIPGAVGLFLVTAPIWHRNLVKRTVYALTDRRALIWQPSLFGSSEVRSYTANGLGHMSRVERGDGAGDLVFEEYYTYGNKGGSSRHQRGFLAVPRVREVEDLVRRTLLNP